VLPNAKPRVGSGIGPSPSRRPGPPRCFLCSMPAVYSLVPSSRPGAEPARHTAIAISIAAPSSCCLGVERKRYSRAKTPTPASGSLVTRTLPAAKRPIQSREAIHQLGRAAAARCLASHAVSIVRPLRRGEKLRGRQNRLARATNPTSKRRTGDKYLPRRTARGEETRARETGACLKICVRVQDVFFFLFFFTVRDVAHVKAGPLGPAMRMRPRRQRQNGGVRTRRARSRRGAAQKDRRDPLRHARGDRRHACLGTGEGSEASGETDKKVAIADPGRQG